MLNSKIVFILGAGAGQDIGMPLGSTLANTIANKMRLDLDSTGKLAGNGDQRMLTQLCPPPNNYSDWVAAAKRINAGIPLTKSIDDFLDIHSQDQKMVMLGKAAIIRAILEAEKSSHFYFDQRHMDDSINFVAASGSWFVKLMHMLGPGAPAELLEKVAFINFNYDRCLEHFLFHAVRGLYSLSDSQVAGIVRKVPIVHPYGFLGNTPDLGGDTPFGHTTGAINTLLTRIKTYTEASGEAEVSRIQNLITSAAALVFMGFAYHTPNMKLFKTEEGLGPTKIYGTAIGISDTNAMVVKGRIQQLFRADIHHLLGEIVRIHSDLDCSKLVDQYNLMWPEI